MLLYIILTKISIFQKKRVDILKKDKNKNIEEEKNKDKNIELENKEKAFHKPKKPNLFLKRLKFFVKLFFFIILASGIYCGIYIYRWQSLAKDMIYNTPSSVLDTDGKVIAELGNNKNTKNSNKLMQYNSSTSDYKTRAHSRVDFHLS